MAYQLIYGEEDRLLPWALERIGIESFRRDAYSLGLEREGELVAVVVYDGFSRCDCNMHLASDGSGKWMNKAILAASFAYPFIQLRLNRVTGLVPAKNQEALKLNEHLGFEREGLCLKALPDDDMVVMGLLRENCRWVPKESRI